MNRILLVNDCKFERVVMKDMLTSLGYEVYTSDEYGVLTKIKELSPNILICNLLMKETRGNLLVGKAKEVFPNIKCYVSSNNDITLEEYKDNDVNGVIKTPTDLNKLSKILEVSINPINNDRNINDSRKTGRLVNAIPKMDKLSNKEIGINIQDNIIHRLSSKSSKVLKYCPYCGESIEKFNGKLAFCPFCGGEVK
jgi:DNA-binding NtrC family response regulator